MTSTTSLASRTGGPPLLSTSLPAGTSPGAPAGAGRASGPQRAGASPVLATRTTGTSKAASTKAKATTSKKATAKKPAAKASTTKPGYAQTTLPAEYAFLRDPKLSLDQKLSRFIGLVMAKAEGDLLAQMEKMAPGSATKGGTASGATSTSGTGGSSSAGATGAAAPKKKGFSIWSAVKVIMPAVGIAAGVLGDAATKKLVQQLSGPVLAAAATALGMPQLAPIALQAGKALGAVATDDERGAGAAVTALGGMAASALTSTIDVAGGATAAGTKAATGGATGSSGTAGTTSSGGTAGTTGTASRSELADQLELQRLMERQKETFSLLSNILRTNHEARMASIQNIR